jgi:hypothetical protein
MIVRCSLCREHFDDDTQGRLCPHYFLNLSHWKPYSRRNDHCNCNVCVADRYHVADIPMEVS